MDSNRFDALSRALARRQRARLLSAGAAAASAPDARAQETEPGLGADGICRMVFEATVRVRTSLFGSAPEVTRGMLELDIGDNGGITGDSRLVLEDGESAPVVGQGPGQSIALRISLGEQRTSDCAGVFSGRTIGPLDGDLGDWTATAGDAVAGSAASTPSGPSNQPGSGSSNGLGGSGGSGGSSGNPTPTTTPCTLTQNDCSDLLLDLERCACICQNTGEPICGTQCCSGGATCVDGTTCVCPGGVTYCEGHCLGCPPGATCQDNMFCICPSMHRYCDLDNTCKPCQEGRSWDPNDCSCTSTCPGAMGAVCNGTCVDLAVDPAHCGACGVACANGQTCVNGACQCAAGWTLCGDTCRNLSEDRRHCGECFYQCGAFDSCIQGTCG